MSVDSAVSTLRSAETHMRDDPPDSIQHKKEVLEEYRPLFQPEAVDTLSEDRFKEFLLYENNRHWTGLHRKRSLMTDDLEQLREGLQTLVNEDQELATRVQEAKNTIDGMGKATLSAILLLAYPDRYGVWNNRSEEALKQLDIWPTFERGMSFGEKYARVNDILHELSTELDIDHWDLDALLGYVVANEEALRESPSDADADTGEFVKERHLQQYLVNHWETIHLSQEWEIYSDSEDPDAGVEFSTGVGRPDLLLTHKSNSRVCVVELKKSDTSDKAVGQLLRYIGWVRENLDQLEAVESDATVEGRLIVREPTTKLEYALSAVSDVTLHQYEVDFTLTTHN